MKREDNSIIAKTEEEGKENRDSLWMYYAESFREDAALGRITQEEADKKYRIYEFLNCCDLEDLFILFDSAAFNDIAESYVQLTVEELTRREIINDEQAAAVRGRFYRFLDECLAKEAWDQTY